MLPNPHHCQLAPVSIDLPQSVSRLRSKHESFILDAVRTSVGTARHPVPHLPPSPQLQVSPCCISWLPRLSDAPQRTIRKIDIVKRTWRESLVSRTLRTCSGISSCLTVSVAYEEARRKLGAECSQRQTLNVSYPSAIFWSDVQELFCTFNCSML